MAPSRAFMSTTRFRIFEEVITGAATTRARCFSTGTRNRGLLQPTHGAPTGGMISHGQWGRSTSNTTTQGIISRNISTTHTENFSSTLQDSFLQTHNISSSYNTVNTTQLQQLSTPKNPILVGRVTKAGYLPTIVQVTRNIQKYDRYLKKHFRFDDRYLVFDPYNALREGDVVEFTRIGDEEFAARVKAGKGKSVRHVVRRVTSPFGIAVEERGLPEGVDVESLGASEGERMERLKRSWKKRVQEEREQDGEATEVLNKLKKVQLGGGAGAGGSRQQHKQTKLKRAITERVDEAEQVQNILDRKGVDEKEVKRRVDQAGISSGYKTGRAEN